MTNTDERSNLLALDIRRQITLNGVRVDSELTTKIAEINQDKQWLIRYFGFRVFINPDTFHIEGFRKL